jgi:hypothetical protein
VRTFHVKSEKIAYFWRIARHIAVIALVGWSLIGPPLNNTGRMIPSAPLYSWKVMASFDTSAECTSNLQLLQKEVRTARKSQPDPALAAVLESATFAKCVPSDDARLKRPD